MRVRHESISSERTASMLQTIPVAERQLRRTPGFAVLTVLVLALGIGLSVAVFTVADALLLRPLPVREQDRIVALWGRMRNGSFDHYPLGLDASQDFARHTRRLQQVGFVSYEG